MTFETSVPTSGDICLLAKASSNHTDLSLCSRVVFQPMPKETKSYICSSLNQDVFRIFENIPPTLEVERERLSLILKSFRSKKSNFELPAVLVFGKPGCGQSDIFKSLSLLSGLPLESFDCCLVRGDSSGSTEGKLKQVFSLARDMRPCILVLKNIDVLAKTAEGKQDQRVLSALSHELQVLKQLSNENHEKFIFIIGETCMDPSSNTFDLKLANIFDVQVTF